MSPEQQRIAIAEACGWTHTKTIHNPDPTSYGRHPVHTANVTWDLPLPDYLSDLNAMHEAEKVLISSGGLPTYEHFLRLNEIKEDNVPWFGSIHATAPQRAEAFLRTLNLWKD